MKTPADSEAELTAWMGPTEANLAGNVHGGHIMKLVDEVAALAAMRHSGSRVVTAAIDRMSFEEPVLVGQVLCLRARVNAVWRSSMEVGVRVMSEDVTTGEQRHTASAYLTMVALDSQGRPCPVAGLDADSPEDQRRAQQARLRRQSRLRERQRLDQPGPKDS